MLHEDVEVDSKGAVVTWGHAGSTLYFTQYIIISMLQEPQDVNPPWQLPVATAHPWLINCRCLIMRRCWHRDREEETIRTTFEWLRQEFVIIC